jgi:predicted RNase H-like HicB family nuclease
VLSKSFGRNNPPHKDEKAITISVLCRFWAEDGVWNGSAVDLPVSIYGKTIEQAQKHLLDAIICHLEALQEVGQLDAEIKRLQPLAEDCRVSVAQMSDDELLWKTTAKVFDHRIAAVACP